MRGVLFAMSGGFFLTLQSVANARISSQIGTWQAATLTQFTGFVVALLWDTLGWFGLTAVPFTWKTVVGIVLIVGGVLVFQLSEKVKPTRASVNRAS